MAKSPAQHTAAYRRSEARKRASGELPPNICTTPGCRNERDSRFKRCRPCLDRANSYKQKYPFQEEASGRLLGAGLPQSH